MNNNQKTIFSNTSKIFFEQVLVSNYYVYQLDLQKKHTPFTVKETFRFSGRFEICI